MAQTRIREIAEDDIETVLDLTIQFEEHLISIENPVESKVLPRETYEKVLRAGLKDDRHLFFVLEEAGEVIGFADLWYYPEFLHGGISSDMHNIFIRKDKRNRGYGKQLMNRIITEARSLGAVALHVPVKSKNIDAIRFYRRMGIDTEYLMLESQI
jgi:GNAT superfamily N-acetyltransferase